MFKNIANSLFQSLSNVGINLQQSRNAFVLKRKYKPNLHRIGFKPHRLRARHFYYETEVVTDFVRRPDLKLILTEYVSGLGDVGDVVDIRPHNAYISLILPKLAVYYTPENIAKYLSVGRDGEKKIAKKFTSQYVEKTLSQLSYSTIPIQMNIKTPWILEPWHVKIAFRMNGFEVPDHAIELPSNQISGPDLSLEQKEFLVTVTVNKTEKVQVRCRIFHWGKDGDFREIPEDFLISPKEALFSEQAQLLSTMPLSVLITKSVNKKK